MRTGATVKQSNELNLAYLKEGTFHPVEFLRRVKLVFRHRKMSMSRNTLFRREVILMAMGAQVERRALAEALGISRARLYQIIDQAVPSHDATVSQ